MPRIISSIVFLVLLTCTIAAATAQRSAETRSQETINAIQDQRYQQSEARLDNNSASILALTAELSALRSSLDRLTGIGIGLGASLTVLQALLVILTFKNGRNRQ